MVYERQGHQVLLFLGRRAGPRFTNAFPSQFKFDGNFVSHLPRFWYGDRYKILYMSRQLHCRGMCKNVSRSDGQHWYCTKLKLPSNLDYGQNRSWTAPSSAAVLQWKWVWYVHIWKLKSYQMPQLYGVIYHYTKNSKYKHKHLIYIYIYIQYFLKKRNVKVDVIHI